MNPSGPTHAPASGRELRDLKARAQRLEPVLKIGRSGLSVEFFAALDQCLADHGLVKVRFEEFKDRKRELVPELVSRSGAQLVQRVGNVAVLFRRRSPPTPAVPAVPEHG